MHHILSVVLFVGVATMIVAFLTFAMLRMSLSLVFLSLALSKLERPIRVLLVVPVGNLT